MLGKESPFSEILQQMVNTMLEGEIESLEQIRKQRHIHVKSQ
ncbi:hypothetical protein A33Q_0147 [Indibacter alkaliphilus LW1]|uniref:Uncharacterized protein n=1 Tax=Indibacter alkaliphilus (strain CCUG 57479 / KCTC 22604 / LW1) TaxID=1189612 RepID=S2DSL2_INDAL|nr:hypothetical protein A33Q_0147 [Indibacter alkaliphilus LW1]